jgi:hypothetical protein
VLDLVSVTKSAPASMIGRLVSIGAIKPVLIHRRTVALQTLIAQAASSMV